MFLPQPMTRGTLIARYKRFFADVQLANGDIVTAHCANPGAMLGLKQPGLAAWISPAGNPARSLRWDLQFIELPGGLVGINTSHPNRVVAEALAEKRIAPLAAYSAAKPEVRYGEQSRIDFLLTGEGLPDCYLEIKNVHFSRTAGLAEFPDSPTERGTRHLAELARMTAAGHRAVMLYLVQRADCRSFALAADLDPTYSRAFAEARHAGVEALCYDCDLSTAEIRLGRALPI